MKELKPLLDEAVELEEFLVGQALDPVDRQIKAKAAAN
jgi:hypothetical protein